MKNKAQDRETLLYILFSYKKLIERNKKDFPGVLISDLENSIDYVLNRNNYTEINYKNYKK
jgi:hypothetical protein